MSTLREEMELRLLLAPLSNVEPVRPRHRLRAHKAWVVVAAAATAGLLTLGALAATGTWVFSSSPQFILGSDQVSFHGSVYTVDAESAADGRAYFALALVRGTAPHTLVFPTTNNVVAFASGSSILAAPGVKQLPLLPTSPKPSGPAFGAINYNQHGGQIWFGDARPNITRIVITDQHGHTFSADTSKPPPAIKLAFRFWVIALPNSTGTEIAGYDSHGTLADKRPIYGLVRTMYLH